MTQPRPSQRRGYHHGDLPAALKAAALELVAVTGPRGFKLSEVAKQAGVANSAPYRHFKDRDDLLAEIAVDAHIALNQHLARVSAVNGGEALVQVVSNYVEFAAKNRGAFIVVSGAGLDKKLYPRLQAISDQVLHQVLEHARRHCGPQNEGEARELATTLWAVAHGHAVLVTEGGFANVGIDAVVAAAHARNAARTIVDAVRLTGVRPIKETTS